MKRYSVSIVYEKTKWFSRETWLCAVVTDAANEDEALGKTINHFGEETKGYKITNKLVIQIEEIN